jgi:hypothetical protein
MRQDKTGKLIANHFIQPTGVLCKLTAQKTTDKVHKLHYVGLALDLLRFV